MRLLSDEEPGLSRAKEFPVIREAQMRNWRSGARTRRSPPRSYAAFWLGRELAARPGEWRTPNLFREDRGS